MWSFQRIIVHTSLPTFLQGRYFREQFVYLLLVYYVMSKYTDLIILCHFPDQYNVCQWEYNVLFPSKWG